MVDRARGPLAEGSPQSAYGRVGGRVWLVVLPLLFLFTAKEIVPTLPRPASRDLGLFLESTAGQDFMRGRGAGSPFCW